MPFRNEHACRIRDPARFQQRSFRRLENETDDGKRLSMIMGRLPGESTLTLQAFRYPATEAGQERGWTAAEARAHCTSHNGLGFEAAAPDSERESTIAIPAGTIDADEHVRLRTERSASRRPDLQIDRATGVLRGVSVIERGAAIGHDFDIDEQTLTQVMEHGNRAPAGIKSRLTHPNACHDGLGREAGRCRNFRLSEAGDRVLADLHLLDALARSPEGDYRTWLLDIADEDPGQIGMSVVFSGTKDQPLDRNGEPTRGNDGRPLPPVFRVKALHASDVVDSPAANRRGLFGTAELAAGATAMLDRAIAAYPIAGGLQEPDYVAIAQLGALTGAAAFTAGDRTINLSNDDTLTKAAAFAERYLTRRGIRHDPIDPALLRRVLAPPATTERTPTMPPEPVALSTPPAVNPTPAPAPLTTPPAPAPAPASPDVDAAVQRALAAEDRRRREITAIVDLHRAHYPDIDALGRKLLDERTPLETAKGILLDWLNERQRNPRPDEVTPVRVGAGPHETFVALAADAMLIRSSLDSAIAPAADVRQRRISDVRATGLAGCGPKQIARECLRLAGVRGVDRMGDRELYERAMGAPRTVAYARDDDPYMLEGGVGHATGDFPLILANAGNKALIAGFNEALVTWSIWCRTGDLNDFKTANRIRMSESPLLVERPEGMPAEQGTFNEKQEPIKLRNYAKGFSYTRQMFVNDDLGAFLSLGRLFGSGANSTIERLVYENLELNSGTGPTMQDGLVLFHATHANLNSGGAGAPTQALLDAQMKAMMSQKGTGEDGAKIAVGAPPRFYFSNPGTALTIAAITQAPFRGTEHLEQPQDPIFRNAQTIKVPQLALQGNGIEWYAVADQSAAPSYEVAFLNGQRVPRTKTVVGTTVDGVTIVVDHDFAIHPTGGWEGINRNAGA